MSLDFSSLLCLKSHPESDHSGCTMASNVHQRASRGPFNHILVASLDPNDHEWNFDTPGSLDLDSGAFRGCIKKISIALDKPRQHHQMRLMTERVEPNRATNGIPLHQLLLVSFAEFRPLLHREDVDTIVNTSNSPSQLTNWRDCTDYMIRLLRTGIRIGSVEYNFYGHSNSQLKSRSCFLLALPRAEISAKVEGLGDFSKLKGVAKKAKRIGLLFSTAQAAVDIPPGNCEDIPDIENAGYVFTDGCGLIAPRLASELARKLRILFRDRRYTPSVFQLRYRGYKGVVTVDHQMRDGGPLLRLRKSMKKFKGGNDHSFAVVGFSKVQLSYVFAVETC